jgi:hypothetical protein
MPEDVKGKLPISGRETVSATQRGAFRRSATAGSITHGYIPAAQAERIFREALRLWGMESSSEEGRTEVLLSLAEVLCAGTSVEIDYSAVLFSMQGNQYRVDVLVQLCISEIGADNPLRVWIRSFRSAILTAMMSDFLDTPDNVAARNRAALAYGTDMNHVQFAFDMAANLVDTGRSYNGTDRAIIAALRIYKTNEAMSSAHARGQSQPSQDTSGGRVGGGRADRYAVPDNPAPARLGFASVR